MATRKRAKSSNDIARQYLRIRKLGDELIARNANRNDKLLERWRVNAAEHIANKYRDNLESSPQFQRDRKKEIESENAKFVARRQFGKGSAEYNEAKKQYDRASKRVYNSKYVDYNTANAAKAASNG